MKINFESTKFERLCNLVGWIMAIAGLITLTVIGAFSGYSNGWVLLVGFVLLILGIFVSRSKSLLDFLG